MSVFIGYPSFMAYQMMKGNNDGFPSISGMIARYSALGLTNEQMAENPVWVDKTGNGHDLQMKNFAWNGMSGCGGYSISKETFSYTPNIYTRNFIEPGKGIKEFDVYFQLIGLDENSGVSFNLDIRESGTSKKIKRETYTKDGIYHFEYKSEGDATNVFMIGYNGDGGDRTTFTVKILPYYAGALVFDGVDDYGICENFPILTKEKGYTVVALRQYLVDKSTAYLTANGDSIPNTSFILEGNNYKDTWNFGKATAIKASRILATQTSKQYDGVKLNIGTNTEGSNLLQVGKWSESYSNVAIWELVFLDHDATEEELTKIKDYFVKTYPWLFPDQAWTVVGKTNEDEDRATIANITGNGNDLVLSNFGFAEGSGYGLYYQYFGNEFKATNGEIKGGGWNIIDNYNISHDKRIPINSVGKCLWGNKALVNGIKLRFKLTGMTEGDVLAFGYDARYDLTYTSDGIYAIDLPPVDKPYGFSLQSSLTENLPTTPVTIKLLPFEYEGYLVTDGVDDKIVSSIFGMGKDFTIVGDWKFIDNKKSGTGLVKGSSFYIYNTMIGLDLYINSGSVKNSLDGIKGINAACSDGRAYDRNWNEILANTGNVVGSGGMLEVSSSGGRFDRIAFKNLAIYPRILSKDDCIKAYNYLQTLKAK